MAMSILLAIYQGRNDLQEAFPEVKDGDVKRLLEWAVSCGVEIDSAKNILTPIHEELKKLLETASRGELNTKAVKDPSLQPPHEMIMGIGGSYDAVGEEFFRYFKNLCNLKPSDWVLDVGCGVGRMAVPLTGYLTKEGGYEGFDIVGDWIKWCKNNITPKYPNFNFQLADVYNKEYNPKGSYNASDYRFPYDDCKFDFIFLTSVFTHMLPCDLENYMSEISRVLKMDGRCLITYFLINQESLAFIGRKKSTIDFEFDLKGYYTANKEKPEAAIAYDEPSIRELHDKYGLNIQEPIRYGGWCGRSKFLSYQDIVISKKSNDLSNTRKMLSYKYIHGTGIEIGALHQPVAIPESAKVLYVDRMSTSSLRKTYPELQNSDMVEVDIIDDGEKLSKIADNSQDFVIANHFLEHCEDPIETMENFTRVLKPEGIIYFSLPDKRFTFDKDRPVTPLEHLIKDHEEGPAISRRDHYIEYAHLVSHTGIEHAEAMISINMSIHFHVWTKKEMLDLINYFERKLPLSRKETLVNKIEVIIILEKLRIGQKV